MGANNNSYCDGCGIDIGQARIGPDCIQITAIGSNGTPAIMYLCTQPEAPKEELEPAADNVGPMVPKIKGCAKKVLTKDVLGRLYKDVDDYTGEKNSVPFNI